GLVMAAGEQSELDRLPRRARSRRSDRRLVGAGLAGQQPNRGEVAELALTRAHRHGRVALRELDRVEAFGDRTLHILRRHVLADADEAFVATACQLRRRRALLEPAGRRADDLDAGRELRRHEDATPRPGL